MSEYTVGIVGTGPHPETSDHEGYSMGYRHAESYSTVAGCRLAACVDVAPDHVVAFADEFGLDDERAFTDLESMLDTVAPDIISLCTPPSTRPELVATCARHDAVEAIHCEKPLAETFGGSREVLTVCDEHDVQLTVNLQHRCSAAATAVKSAVEEGAIGDIRRVEVGRRDLLQTGLHQIDLANFVLGDESVEWVLGQIDYSGERVWYTDMYAESQGLGLWEYESGAHALCSTGDGEDAVGQQVNRFIGSDGQIEYRLSDGYEIRTDDSNGWRTVDVEGKPAQERAIEAVVDGLETGAAPINRGETALTATEIVFGIWESSRRRGRVTLPLDIDDNPLQALIEAGELPPEPQS